MLFSGKAKDMIGLYTADILFGKTLDLSAPSRPRQNKDVTAIKSIIECIMKNPCSSKEYLRTLVRKIINL